MPRAPVGNTQHRYMAKLLGPFISRRKAPARHRTGGEPHFAKS